MNSKTKESPSALAAKFINSTGRNIFLTGRAGTGKTTFLKEIVHKTHKNTVVAAPTGIAAINAEGVTLHSLFHLPFGAFVPSYDPFSDEITTQINTPQSILKTLRMNKNKRKLIREIELLIIDEVSMLRADTLDAIDTVLRHIRRKRNLPFGGIQILFIGDLLQLPPVIRKKEYQYLKAHYNSGYFFEAKALENQKPLYIELEKIFRQTDKRFIRILNNLRDNAITNEDIEILNQHHKPSFKPKSDEGYVFLTTHNHKADSINKNALQELPGKPVKFDAYVEGDFGEHLYPVEYTLELKKGAQVMFIKNDYSGEQRYFNGKIGTVTELTEDEVEVNFTDGTPPALVDEYTWENKTYTLEKETNSIKERIKGTFTQLPLKLAWAITVHKSQGLTFQKAIVDVSQAFAPGQIYVALSRLVSLDGLILNKPIPRENLGPDEELREFAKNKKEPGELKEEYSKELPLFIREYIINSFDFNTLLYEISQHVESYKKDEVRSKKQQYKNWAVGIRNEIKELKQISDKFIKQLTKLTDSRNENDDWLLNTHKRTIAAINYFEPLLKDISKKINELIIELRDIPGVKKYQKELKEIDSSIFQQRQSIQKAGALLDAVLNNKEISGETMHTEQLNKEKAERLSKSKESKKKKKVNTKEISFNLYKAGKNTEQIAEERSLAVSTIEGHLAHYVAEGELDVNQFVDQVKTKQIITVAKALETNRLKEIKSKLGDEFTYSDIRFAMASLQFQNEKNSST